MKRLLSLLVLFCIYACTSDDSSSAKPTPEGFAGNSTLYAYLDQTPVTETHNGYACPDWHTEIDTAIEVRLPSLQYNLIINWCRTYYYPDCGYDDVRIKVDGKPVENEFSFFYDRDTSLKIMVPDFENEHVIEWTLDSAKCGNFHAKYRLFPSKEPGDYEILGKYRQEEWNKVEGPRIFKKGKLFFDIESHYKDPVYDWKYGYAYADSAQSDCIIAKDGDTLHLPLKVMERESERISPDIRIEADSAKLVDFLGADTAAVVSCALVFQSWIVPKKVDSLQYDFKIRFISFVPEYTDRLQIIDCVNDLPCTKGEIVRLKPGAEWNYNRTSYLLAKTTKGEMVYKRFLVDQLTVSRSFVLSDSDTLESGDSLDLESMQMVSFPELWSGDALLASDWNTWNIANVLDSIYPVRSENNYGVWDMDKNVAAQIDSLMNVLVDKDGNPKEGLWIMAKRLTFKQE